MAKDTRMLIVGSDTRFCGLCERRTKHLKVLCNGVILFLCDESHRDKPVEDLREIARRRSAGHAHDAGCFPDEVD